MKFPMFNQIKTTYRKMLFLLLSALGYAACCQGLTSCGDEYEKFQGIEFKTTGVVLSPINSLLYHGKLDGSATDVTITAIGKNANYGFLSLINTDDCLYEVTDDDWKQALPYTVCEKTWGKIELLSASPYSIRLTLNVNQTGDDRNFELTFGGGYVISTLTLNQMKRR